MENTSASEAPGALGLGPRPARTWPRPPTLSKSRAALLGLLRGQPEPTTLAALITVTGLHANTVREHLESLVGQGLLRRHRAEPTGRGRPAWLYEATEDDSDSRSSYAGLAAALASAIVRSSDSPREDAILAGRQWGHELARTTTRPRKSAAHRQVVDLLDEIGFAPEYDARRGVVRLTRCPLLEAAHKYPDVVCGVHLGIVRGALEEYGSASSNTELFPFSEPGACRLELRTKGSSR